MSFCSTKWGEEASLNGEEVAAIAMTAEEVVAIVSNDTIIEVVVDVDVDEVAALADDILVVSPVDVDGDAEGAEDVDAVVDVAVVGAEAIEEDEAVVVKARTIPERTIPTMVVGRVVVRTISATAPKRGMTTLCRRVY